VRKSKLDDVKVDMKVFADPKQYAQVLNTAEEE